MLPGGLGVGALPVAPGARTTSGSGGSGATSSRTTRAAPGCRSSRSSALALAEPRGRRPALRPLVSDAGRILEPHDGSGSRAHSVVRLRAAQSPLILARRAALVLARWLASACSPAPSRQLRAPAVSGEPRGQPRDCVAADDLRPMRRGEPPDDAQHHAPGTTDSDRTQRRLQDLARAWSGPDAATGFERQGASRARLGRRAS